MFALQVKDDFDPPPTSSLTNPDKAGILEKRGTGMFNSSFKSRYIILKGPHLYWLKTKHVCFPNECQECLRSPHVVPRCHAAALHTHTGIPPAQAYHPHPISKIPTLSLSSLCVVLNSLFLHDSAQDPKPAGMLRLDERGLICHSPTEYTLEITNHKKTYVFRSSSAADMASWLKAISACIPHDALDVEPPPPPPPATDSPSEIERLKELLVVGMCFTVSPVLSSCSCTSCVTSCCCKCVTVVAGYVLVKQEMCSLSTSIKKAKSA